MWRKFCFWYIVRIVPISLTYIFLHYFFLAPWLVSKLPPKLPGSQDPWVLALYSLSVAPLFVLNLLVKRTAKKFADERLRNERTINLDVSATLRHQKELFAEIPDKTAVAGALYSLEQTFGRDREAARIVLQFASRMELSLPWRGLATARPQDNKVRTFGLTQQFGFMGYEHQQRNSSNQPEIGTDLKYQVGNYRLWRTINWVFFQNIAETPEDHDSALLVVFDPMTMEQTGFGVSSLFHEHIAGQCVRGYVLSFTMGDQQGTSTLLR